MSTHTEQRKLAAIIPLSGTDMNLPVAPLAI